MFKKKPQIKNLSSLRSSDRRKRADQVISQYNIQVPTDTTAPPPSSPADTQPAQTLTSIRNSLFPENCSSARFTTYAGPDNKLISGTIYVGAHGQEERVLWLQWGVDTRLYPTVYTLWQNPGLVPLLHTPGIVVQKLKTGADLMIPGLFGGPPWPDGAKKDCIVAVASLERPSVPVFVGVCEIDISVLSSVRGVKGKAVEGLHWAGDEVWNWSPSNLVVGGREPPDALQGWGDELADDRLAEETAELHMDDDEDTQDEGGVSLDETADGHPRSHSGIVDNDEGENEDDREPTTQEVDDAFLDAFLYAVYNAKKNGRAPYYGLDLPGIMPSYLIANMIQPHLRSQSQHYTIKKTSWKTVKKFIKYLDKRKLVKSKDRNGGETVIIDIDFDDIQVKQFTPYRLPKPKIDDSRGGTSSATNGATSNPGLTLQHLFRVSSKLVPDLVPSKTEFYTRHEISDHIRTYIDNNSDLITGSKRFVKLNPFIANNILHSASDAQVLAAGQIARDFLSKRVLDDHNLCVPFWVLLKADQKWDADDRSLSKPRAGPPPKVTLTIEKRTGTKTVTRVAGLETFNVNPQTLAPELQKRCASSCVVEQAVGSKPGMLEIMVQGDQQDIVKTELGKRGIKKDWFEVVDKTKKKGAGGAGSGVQGGRS